jgi:hypothetical protein
VRPNKLRFEWEEARSGDTDFNILWSDGKDTFSYDVFPWVSKNEDLELGIAGATGISRGSSHTIPSLLMSELSGFRLTEMDRLSLLREEQFEGEDCFVVQGFHPFGFPIEMWISKNDFLLRKSRDQNHDGYWQEEIRRGVRINGDIAAEVFEYAPPSVTERIFKGNV